MLAAETKDFETSINSRRAALTFPKRDLNIGGTQYDRPVVPCATGVAEMSFDWWFSRQRHVWVSVIYRHVDTQLAAWPIASRLARDYGRERLFFDGFVDDGDNFQPGDSIAEKSVLFAGSASCVILLIGSAWLRPELFDPADVHRKEVEAALANPRSTIIPVLIEGVQMPFAAQLPESISAISDRVALSIECGSNYDAQTERLSRAIASRLR